VIGVVLALGFLLLLVALQAPLIAAAGVLTNLLAVGAAFGVARLIFQERPRRRPARLRAAGLPRRLGPGVLLRDDLRDLDGLHRVPALSAKEHWDRSGDPREAMVGGSRTRAA
jgi:RND superfamily putative drug exporter